MVPDIVHYREPGRQPRGIVFSSLTAVDLYWLRPGAGGHSVRLNGRVFEAFAARLERRERCDLYHPALEVHLPGARFVIEMTPIPLADRAERGVVAGGAVGARTAGRFRLFRYEVRRWRDGVIPDVAEAVESPRRLSSDSGWRSACSSSCRRRRRRSGGATSCTPARCGTRTR